MASAKKNTNYENFLKKYPQTKKIDATTFGEIWQHYDSNNSGYIDNEGLDKFFRDLLTTISSNEVTPELVKDLKDCYMDCYDEAGDGRIAITELANILPTDENFILLFRREEKLKSTVDLMKLWTNYDKGRSGYITKAELASFIKDLLAGKGKQVSDEKVQEYAKGILNIFDKNNDGHLSLIEMARLLAIKTEENFLMTCSKVCKFGDLTEKDRRKRLAEVFDHYDKGKTNFLEGPEIDLFVKDLLDFEAQEDSFGFDDSMRRVQIYKEDMMSHCDKDGDGKLSKSELMFVLGFYG